MYANFQQFPIKWSFRGNSQTKSSTFIVFEMISPFHEFEVPPLARPAPPTPPVFRAGLLHTELGVCFMRLSVQMRRLSLEKINFLDTYII